MWIFFLSNRARINFIVRYFCFALFYYAIFCVLRLHTAKPFFSCPPDSCSQSFRTNDLGIVVGSDFAPFLCHIEQHNLEHGSLKDSEQVFFLIWLDYKN